MLKNIDIRGETGYNRPHDVRGHKDGFGDWTNASGDLLILAQAATITHGALTFTAREKGADANKYAITIRTGRAADEYSTTEVGGVTTFIFSFAAAALTIDAFEERFNDTHAHGVIALTHEDENPDTTAVAAGTVRLAGGEEFLNASSIYCRVGGTVKLVGRGDGDDDAVTYTLIAGQGLRIYFDKIIAQGSTAALTILGHSGDA